MTFRKRQEALMADLLAERDATTNIWWAERLDQKIAELRAAMHPPHNDGPEHVCPECVRTLLERE